MTREEGNGWDKYQLHVLEELKRLNGSYTSLKQDIEGITVKLTRIETKDNSNEVKTLKIAFTECGKDCGIRYTALKEKIDGIVIESKTKTKIKGFLIGFFVSLMPVMITIFIIYHKIATLIDNMGVKP